MRFAQRTVSKYHTYMSHLESDFKLPTRNRDEPYI
jgi:hypothetical protein